MVKSITKEEIEKLTKQLKLKTLEEVDWKLILKPL
jgi:hypothetical protein